MNAITLLKKDHKKVKELFEEFEDLGEHAYKQKEKLVGEILAELDVHTRIEEEIFYPAVREKVEKEGRHLLAEAYEEHAVVKRLMQEVQSLNPQDERYDAKVKVIMDSVKHHIKEEENELFPEAKKALKEEVEDIGEQLEERKQELLESFEEVPEKKRSSG